MAKIVPYATRCENKPSIYENERLGKFGAVSEHQPRLFFNAFQQIPPDVIVLTPVDSYSPFLWRVVELPVAAFLASQNPSVLFQIPNDFNYFRCFHTAKVVNLLQLSTYLPYRVYILLLFNTQTKQRPNKKWRIE